MRSTLTAFTWIFIICCCTSCKKNIDIYAEEPKKEQKNSPPSAFKAVLSDITSNSVNLTWEAAIDPDYSEISYKIELNGAILTSGLKATKFQATNLKPKTKYAGKIIATDADGMESFTSIEFTTSDGTIRYIYDYNLYNSSNLNNQHCISLSDESIIVSGSITDNIDGSLRHGIIYRITKNGERLWYKYFDISPYRASLFLQHIIIPLPSGNEFVYAYGNRLIKMNANGDILWDKTPTSDIGGQYFSSGIITKTQELVFATSQQRIIKVSLDGQLLYVKNNVSTVGIKDIVEDSKGNFYVCGESPYAATNGTQHWLAKLTADGSMVWEKSFFKQIDLQSERSYATTDLLIDGNDRLYLIGSVYDFNYLRLFKFDDNGTMLYNSTVNDSFRPTTAKFTRDNKLLISGYLYGQVNVYPQMKRFDTDCKENLNRRFDELAPNILFDIIDTSDGGFFAITHSYGIKLNADGLYK